MEQFDFLVTLIEKLENLGLPHFVSGSIATMYYGEPRTTKDVDIVMELKLAHVHHHSKAIYTP